MSSYEEDLYHACMKFCTSFFHLLIAKEDLRRGFAYDSIEKERIIGFEEERVKYAYSNLFNKIENIENSKRGVVGKNEYQLVLKRLSE